MVLLTEPETAYPWRQTRLARGWEPLDVVGRLKWRADREGLFLPPAWLLTKWLFLWENQRAALPEPYKSLLAQVFAFGGEK